MKKLFIMLLLAGFILSSCDSEKEIMTNEKRKDEEGKIVTVINNYNKASQEKNWYALVETLADEVVFFGTDSAEVITSFSEYKKAIEKQWQEYDKVNYGELNDISIQMDNEGTLASIIFGHKLDVMKGTIAQSFYVRGARVLKKDKDKWVIVSGIVGIVRSGDTVSDELKIKADSTNQQPK